MIEPERIRRLSSRAPRGGRYVLYWMQQSQRARNNPALEFAVAEANERNLPVVVAFGLTADFPEAKFRHYAFMLEGLRETRRALEARGIQLIARLGDPADVALDFAGDAALVVTDRGYLRVQKRWRRRVAAKAPCPVVQVESDVVVPVDSASNHEEYSAATLRPKILRLRGRFLRLPKALKPRRDSLGLALGGINLDTALGALDVDRSVGPATSFIGGASQAQRLLARFVKDKLDDYAGLSSDPGADCVSRLGPYLHFGQISPVEVALAAMRSRARRKSKDAFLEQLIVRRELSMNFCEHHPRYDSFRAIPPWARATLRRHANDRREYDYPLSTLEAARTHDPHWNAAMREMISTGFMHNTMRMYWAKKVVEWTRSPELAFRRLVRLNNKYFLDGREANSFAGIAWCFGKHDRPWGERPVFGTVRWMGAAGLDRKYDMAAYAARVGSENPTVM